MVDFDCEMDFMANRANFDYYWQEFKQLEATMKKPTNFFSVSEFKYPTFQSMQSELEVIDSLG
jgi:translation elongation factor EF-Ts